MATPPVGSSGSSQNDGTQKKTENDALTGLDLDQFLKLMITELQNQDPLNPMENNEILQQIGTMRSIASNAKLGDTLDSVLLGQNVSSASSMIGKQVRALDNDGDEVTGVVDKVSIADNVPTLHIGDSEVKLTNVREILKQDDTAATNLLNALFPSS